jgi:hypothetical protein
VGITIRAGDRVLKYEIVPNNAKIVHIPKIHEMEVGEVKLYIPNVARETRIMLDKRFRGGYDKETDTLYISEII